MAGGSVALSGMELPPLPLEEWEDTKETLHRYCQIVGKIRMELAPFKNHWWHVTLYVTPRGLTTGPIPYSSGTFDISFDLLDNRLVVATSEGGGFGLAIDNLPVAEFYGKLMEGLGSSGVDVSINSGPSTSTTSTLWRTIPITPPASSLTCGASTAYSPGRIRSSMNTPGGLTASRAPCTSSGTASTWRWPVSPANASRSPKT